MNNLPKTPAVQRARDLLSWKIVHEPAQEYEPPAIWSDPVDKKHMITIPKGIRESEYLHELAHAYLAETINPLFSTMFFSPSGQELGDLIVEPYRCAGDWFVDEILMKWAPHLELSETGLDLNRVLDPENSYMFTDIKMLLSGALIVAESVHRHRLDAASVPKVLCSLVNKFLVVPPIATIENLEILMNELLRYIHRTIQVEITSDEDGWFFQVTGI